MSFYISTLRSAQYGCYLYFLDFVLSRYIAQFLTLLFWDRSNCPHYYWLSHLFMQSICPLFLLQGLDTVEFCSESFSWSHFCLIKLRNLLTYLFLFITTEYDFRVIVRDGSVHLHLSTPYSHDLPSWFVSTGFSAWSYQCPVLV
jgi:lipid-A-disaccharide synthase-like uncharacterized protein